MTLQTQQLKAGYDHAVIINDISMTIAHGKITALIGPNGCGKSTLLKTLATLLLPLSGQVLWQQQSIQQLKKRDFAQQLAILPQSQETPEGITVKEAVEYGRNPYLGFWGQLKNRDQQIVEQAMVMTGVNNLTEKLLTELSGGQRQRVWLAMTLAQDTDYLLFDEPTTYLDINHQAELMKLMRTLNNSGKTIITVLHDINQACRYCDELIVMKQGKIVAQGAPKNIITSSLLKEVFELDAEIHRDPVANTPMCIVK
jgi:ferric citrate transport system ATP-binding protein